MASLIQGDNSTPLSKKKTYKTKKLLNQSSRAKRRRKKSLLKNKFSMILNSKDLVKE